ncbi:hypothetical protein OBBRIDRAFT_747968 [Obba rivulosa]|uniref:Protein YOP1 n=1 Tax=Obba rivulosa TaxID=1052685 RepID=A0A8E2J4A0_9APHY|nr:hypothetical protein OBBRIDRAFT_747968 [Obba rivulosa]
MPLVVPILRLAYTFLNVFDTFKTLQQPPSSVRNNGKPSIRALSQRKRAMKGCMTVWLVWCCFTVYERTLDSVVCLFVPFYNELKSLVILFLLLTRARGSEPIYLHIIRPFIKPYASTIDTVIEVTSSFCDLIFLVVTMPYYFVVDTYRRWRYPPASPTPTPDPSQEGDVPRANSTTEHSRSERARDQSTAARQRAQRTTQIPRRLTEQEAAQISGGRAQEVRKSRKESRNVEPEAKPATGRRQPSAIPELVSRRSSTRETAPSLEPPPAYEIWYPPPSAYDAETNPMSGLPTPPAEKLASDAAVLEPEDDWRQYPAFPSAYPPTPLPAAAKVLSTNAAPLVPPSFSDIAEESADDSRLSMIAEDSTPRKPGAEGDFQQSLQPPREFLHPDSDGDSSDNGDSVQGVESVSLDSVVVGGEDESMDEDEDEDEEDEFNVTLATPFPVRTMRLPKEKASLASTSSESLVSRSTMLSTTDYGSNMSSRTNSQASTMQTSDDSSVAGRKRRLPIDEPADARRSGVKPRSRASRPVSVKLPTRSQMKERRVRRNSRGTYKCDTSYESSSESEQEQDHTDDSPSSDAKRRRLGAPSENRNMRPTTRRGDSERTIRAVPRAPQEVTLGTAVRAPARKPNPATVVGRDVPKTQRRVNGASGSSSETTSRRSIVPSVDGRAPEPWR